MSVSIPVPFHLTIIVILYLITKNESGDIPKPDGLVAISPEANKQRFSKCYLLPVLDKCGWCSEKNWPPSSVSQLL